MLLGYKDFFYLFYHKDKFLGLNFTIDDYAKDGGDELFTKMHCILLSNCYRIVKDLLLERNASW